MASEWRERPLGELTENFDSVRVPVKEADRRPGSYPYYGASGVVDYVDSYLFEGEYLLIAEDGENLRTRNTPVAFLARGRFWVNNHAHIVRGNREADTRFLMYALAGADISGYLTGSTMPKLTQGNMNRIPLLAPPVDEQRAIANILGTLDDKIELNRRMNETLEAMARAIFKSWFVDFEFANEHGKPYKSSGGKIVQSDLGDIPERWQAKEIKDCGVIICGKTPPTKDKENYGSDIPFITIPDMRNQAFIIKTERNISTQGADLQKKKTLPPLSVCVSCIATPGLISLTSDYSQTNQQINSIVCNKDISPYFMYYAMLAKSEDIKSMGLGGTATLNLNTGNFAKIRILIPATEVMLQFHNILSPLLEKVLANLRENINLCDIRDSLLARLMTGRLRTRGYI